MAAFSSTTIFELNLKIDRMIRSQVFERIIILQNFTKIKNSCVGVYFLKKDRSKSWADLKIRKYSSSTILVKLLLWNFLMYWNSFLAKKNWLSATGTLLTATKQQNSSNYKKCITLIYYVGGKNPLPSNFKWHKCYCHRI